VDEGIGKHLGKVGVVDGGWWIACVFLSPISWAYIPCGVLTRDIFNVLGAPKSSLALREEKARHTFI
jgi:hypothetical protein